VSARRVEALLTGMAHALRTVSRISQVLRESQALSCEKGCCGLKPMAPLTVEIFGLSSHFYLEVPRMWCGTCKAGCSVKPMRVGCMPGSPVQAQSLEKCPAGNRPLWVALELMECIDTMRLEIKTASIEKLVETFLKLHVPPPSAAECEAGVEWDHCRPLNESQRTRLRKALCRVRLVRPTLRASCPRHVVLY
jgi:hypothetical protein